MMTKFENHLRPSIARRTAGGSAKTIPTFEDVHAMHPIRITASRRIGEVMAIVGTVVAYQLNPLHATGQPITADINVKLQPLLQHIDVVTDINLVGSTMFVCTQPGLLYRMAL